MSERHAHSTRGYLIFALLSLLVMLVIISIVDAENAANRDYRTIVAIQRIQSTTIEMNLTTIAGLAVLGLAAGFLGGMTSMGAGIILISCLLIFFRTDIFLARAASMIATFSVVGIASLHHLQRESQRKRLRQVREHRHSHRAYIDLGAASPIVRARGFRGVDVSETGRSARLFKKMIIPALIGALLGVFLGSSLGGDTMRHVFGIFLLFLSFYMLALIFSDPTESRPKQQISDSLRKNETKVEWTIGGLHGFLCGLLGISGGVVTTPMQQILIGSSAYRAITTSLFLSAVCTLFSAVIVTYQGITLGEFTLENILEISLCLVVGSAIGAKIGAKVSEQVNSIVLRVVFVILGLSAGLSILV